jgi:hypothetical protein
VLKAGDTMTGNLIFSLDNTLDIGASLATRPRTVYVGTEVVAPLFTGAVTGASTLNVLKAGDTMTGALLFSPDDTVDIGANAATRPRTVYFGTSALIQKSGIGSTPTDGLQLVNSTAAANNAQQYSTALRFSGRGWGTSGSVDTAVDWRLYVVPVQGATASSTLTWQSSLNGAAFFDKLTLDSSGNLTSTGDIQASVGVKITSNGAQIPAAGSIIYVSRVSITSPSAGIINLADTTTFDFARLQFGGTTSSYPAIARSTTFLDHVLADASGPCQVSCGKSAIGVTPDDALIVKNTTAAANGAQQFSPSIRLQGFGWGTTLGSSQACDWRIYANTVQSTVPTSTLRMDVSVAGGAFTTPFSLANSGALSIGSLSVSAGAWISWSGRSNLASSANGLIELYNTAGTDFTRLNFGGTTSAFPAIARSTTFLDLVLADASGPCQVSCGKDAIGATPTDALIIKNTTAAALGAQQWSPAIRLQASGWGTTLGSSQGCEWRVYVAPVQGLVPTNPLVFASSLAGAAFSAVASISTAGSIAGTSLSSSNNLFVTSKIFIASRTILSSPGDGILSLADSTELLWNRLNLGLNTNAFPALTRSGTNILLTLGDGTGNAGLTTGALTTVACQTNKYLAISGATTLDATHYCVNATANTFDVTLPTAASIAGRTYVIKNSGTGVVTLRPPVFETIDTLGSWPINQYTSLTAMSNGADWILI